MNLTCKQVAKAFRRYQQTSQFRESAAAHQARAEILEAFGDLPAPDALWRAWDKDNAIQTLKHWGDL